MSTRRDGGWASGGALLALPSLAFVLVVAGLPLALLLSFAVSDVGMSRGAIVSWSLTTEHFIAAVTDPLYHAAFARSFTLAASVTVLCLLFGFPIAYLHLRSPGWLRTVILVATIAPLLTSAIVRTYAWIVILGRQRGLLNQALLGLGLIDEPLRLINTHWAVLIGMTQIHLPIMVLPLIAVMSRQDPRLEDAALNLGASRLRTLRDVTLPLAVPGIGAGASLVFALSYTTFVVPQLLGGGNYLNAATMIYEQMIFALDWSKGAVTAAIMLATCLATVFAITIATRRAMRWSDQART
jgi:ABC-type spermidine/putrescine transport system permease subunit I